MAAQKCVATFVLSGMRNNAGCYGRVAKSAGKTLETFPVKYYSQVSAQVTSSHIFYILSSSKTCLIICLDVRELSRYTLVCDLTNPLSRQAGAISLAFGFVWFGLLAVSKSRPTLIKSKGITNWFDTLTTTPHQSILGINI